MRQGERHHEGSNVDKKSGQHQVFIVLENVLLLLVQVLKSDKKKKEELNMSMGLRLRFSRKL